MAFIQAGVRVNLRGEERIIVTDVYITFEQSGKRKDANRLRAGNRGKSINVDQVFRIIVADLDDCLEGRDPHEVAADGSLDCFRGSSIRDGIPITYRFYRSRAGLLPQLYALPGGRCHR